jgi:hypothetical protein
LLAPRSSRRREVLVDPARVRFVAGAEGALVVAELELRVGRVRPRRLAAPPAPRLERL